MPQKKQVIALYSPYRGMGKSTVASYLCNKFGYELIKFAHPVKTPLYHFGLGEAEIEGIAKDLPSNRFLNVSLAEIMAFASLDIPPGYRQKTATYSSIPLGVCTPRDVMDLILKGLQDEFGNDINAKLMRNRLREARKEGKKIVIDDLRFPYEIGLLEENDAYFVRVEREQVVLPTPRSIDLQLEGYNFNDHVRTGAGPLELVYSQINKIIVNRNRVLLCSDNPHKIEEYKRFFNRHSIAVEVMPNSCFDDLSILGKAVSDPSSRVLLVVRDTNLLCEPGGGKALDNPSNRAYHGLSVENVCTIETRIVDADGKIGDAKMDREVIAGWIENAEITTQDSDNVFGWDDVFRNGKTGLSNQEMRSRGLKVSARDLLLSNIVIDRFYPKQGSDLRQVPLRPQDDLPFSISPAKFFLEHPVVVQACPPGSPLMNAFEAAVKAGVFVKSARSRRIGNYWNTNLNGGLPLVPKRDPVQEVNYMAHDLVSSSNPGACFYRGS